MRTSIMMLFDIYLFKWIEHSFSHEFSDLGQCFCFCKWLVLQRYFVLYWTFGGFHVRKIYDIYYQAYCIRQGIKESPTVKTGLNILFFVHMIRFMMPTNDHLSQQYYDCVEHSPDVYRIVLKQKWLENRGNEDHVINTQTAIYLFIIIP